MSDVIYRSWNEVGAPTLNHDSGSLVAVLDACLVNGFNVKSVASIVVAGGVATATIGTHGFKDKRKVAFSGATPGGLNGVKQVNVVDGNTVTFDATGIADGSATGTIVAKCAPLGYTKPYSASGKGVYQRSDPAATTMLLRVDDTYSSSPALVCSVEAATSVDAFSGQAPGVLLNSDGNQFWTKGHDSASAQEWHLIGDGLTFYLFTDTRAGTSGVDGGAFGLMPHGWGDLGTFRAGDAYHCFIGGSGFSGLNFFMRCRNGYSAGDASFVAHRPFTQAGSPVSLSTPGYRANNANVWGLDQPVYPSPVDNGFVVQDKPLVSETNATFGHPFRGYMRGVKQPLASLSQSLHAAELDGLTGSARRHLALRINNNSGTETAAGCVVIDLDGPW